MEIGYITKELKDLACDTMQKATEKILELKVTIKALKEENAALKSDASKWRWLQAERDAQYRADKD